MTGEEIKRRLVDFARKWSLYDGSERSEAQTFLNGLFACYGTDRQDAGARFEEAQKGKFLDLIWPQRCLIEMKRPSEAKRLEVHRDQAFAYWRNAPDAAHNVPAPRFVVLCAFRRFEVWEPGAYPSEPRAEFDLVDLPDRMAASPDVRRNFLLQSVAPAQSIATRAQRRGPLRRNAVLPVLT